ncbi:FAD-dependent oxidoreductase [Kiloniella laminariae]|uniref:D-amino-acid oxidase n=1 Tax=Kiloniella laminariae TaxID=454162 RepID=A0ABT4LP84_9PROT|nr:FAD-dependent oxidoreductase [Kiloniella laminariae]MCZ4282121.1 FAD-dependent oxidoreductase [Kiloniella laminariae]
MRIEIIGSGVVGLSCAAVFAELGHDVTIISQSKGPDDSCCSWWAGGMLAPWCEMESAEPLIGELGVESMEFWSRFSSGHYIQRGTLVVAPARDLPDLKRFGRRTENWKKVSAEEISELEPALAGRFQSGLFYPSEAHFDPRKILQALEDFLRNKAVHFQYNRSLEDADLQTPTEADFRIDCRGLAAQKELPDLRGVKGEMVLIQSDEIQLNRPIRLLHPRIPLYVVPRDNGVFMIGATMIENEERSRASVRSILELLSAAYALHPGFGEAEILEIGVDARPAFPDNLPAIIQAGSTIYVNGMYRHGYLAAPAVAALTADLIMQGYPSVREDRKSLISIGHNSRGPQRCASV